MKRMRFWVAIMIVWMFLVYSIERGNDAVNITGAAYIFVPVVAVLMIAVPAMRKIPLWVLLASQGALFLMIKTWGATVWGSALPLTVTELFIISVTASLARSVSKGVGEFEHALARITIGSTDALADSLSNGETEMYKELKRARNHQRPLGLLAIEVENASIQAVLDRMVQEAVQAMMKQYVLSDVARTLCEKLEDYDIIARHDDNFLILLPEVTSGQLFDLAGRLREVVYEETGVALKVGVASFPEDALTFENLMEKAVQGLEGSVEVEELGQSLQQRQPVTTEHSIS
ncbi:MAG: hypothetical protein RBT47_01100 [Anaerolineae bacterium]|nr:hypothetical protein [Anaerolineae bacterium]